MCNVVLKMLNVVTFLFFVSGVAMADGVIKGKVIDSETREALIGATVTIEGTSIGAATDLKGNFTLKTKKAGEMVIIVRSVGYKEVKRSVHLKKNELNMDTIQLSPVSVGLNEVKVTASVVRKDRETPMAVSDIDPVYLEDRMGTKEFPEIMKSTPSIYATKTGGGFGDSRVNLRGFDSNNIGVLVNGIPVNDMEHGRIYWSNWSGLSDVTQFIQIQRGLGASKLAVNSVGGTMNIITRSTDATRGGAISYGIGNNGYSKIGLNVSTGLMDNGWAVTLAGSRTQSSHGYVDATNFEAWSYFLNVSKQINDAHRLSFTAFGAPQWHNQRGQMHTIKDYEENPNGVRWNSSYGVLNGEIMAGPYAYNDYHKPQISLSHYWNINEQSKLSTSVYVSFADGGGRRAFGKSSRWLSWDNQTGKPYAETMLTPDGLIDYNRVLAQNDTATGGAQVIYADAVNSHDWYGFLSTYTNDLTPELKLTAGIDARYYRGYHYIEITDLLGGKYYMGNNLAYQDPAVSKFKGDRMVYDYTGEVLWAGIFAQAEYVKDNFSGFLSFSITEQSYRRDDPGNYKSGDPMQKTSWENFLPWGVKTGWNYKLGACHNVFVNGGYFTRAPYFSNVFKNNSNELVPDAKYEQIYTFEGGYGVEMQMLNMRVNYYFTKWLDRGLNKSMGNNQLANIRHLNALHQGVEFEATYTPVYNLLIKGMFSFGNWKMTDNAIVSTYDENNDIVKEDEVLYVKDVHVGNSAQMTAAFSATYEPFTNCKIGLDYNFYDKNYADFDVWSRKKETDEGVDSWEMPTFHTFDANLRYSILVSDQVMATLFVNVDNLFNSKYISDAKDGAAHDKNSALVYYGFGRTWSLGMRINF